MVRVILDVAWNKEVRAAIAIVVSPCGASGPSAQSDTRLFRYVGKCAVMIVMVEAVFAEVGNVDIGPAVVVVVRHGHAESPAFIGDASFFRDIGKRSVVIVVQKHGAGSGFLAL